MPIAIDNESCTPSSLELFAESDNPNSILIGLIVQ